MADTRQPPLGFPLRLAPLAFRHRLRQVDQALNALRQTVINKPDSTGLGLLRQAQNPGDERLSQAPTADVSKRRSPLNRSGNCWSRVSTKGQLPAAGPVTGEACQGP